MPNEPVAFSFDGINDYILVPNSLVLNPTKELTIMAWVKFINFCGVGNVRIFDKTWSSQFSFIYNWSSVAFRIWNKNNQSNLVLSMSGFDAMVWYLLAVTVNMNNNSVKLYKNGTLASFGTLSGSEINTTTNDVIIGTNSGVIPAYINNICFYDRELRELEILKAYNEGHIPKNGLKLYFSASLPTTEGGKVIDLSGNGNHGTPYGGMRFPVLRAEVRS